MKTSQLQQHDIDIFCGGQRNGFYPLLCQNVRSCILAIPPMLEITLWVELLNNMRDLGIQMDLKFHIHTDIASGILGLICKSFE